MILVVIASALGVITITGAGLFLRRLFGQITELRRQISRFDRQMRAQRARESFVRQLNEYYDEVDGGDQPAEAAVVNGHEPELPPGLMAGGQAPQPVRRKKHLGLYIGGGLAAALATIGTAAREAIRAQRGPIVATAAGAAVTAATVTLITVQPWADNADRQPPPSGPTAAVSPSYTPPPRSPHSGGPPSGPSQSPTEAAPGDSSSAGTSPSPDEFTGGIVPARDDSRDNQATRPGRSHRRAPGSAPPGHASGPTPPGQTHAPGRSTTPRPSTAPGHSGGSHGGSSGGSNTGGHGRGHSVTVTIPPLLYIEVSPPGS